jgi:hypothetical protein
VVEAMEKLMGDTVESEALSCQVLMWELMEKLMGKLMAKLMGDTAESEALSCHVAGGGGATGAEQGMGGGWLVVASGTPQVL